MTSYRWPVLLLFIAPLSLLAQQDVALFDDTVMQEVRLTIDPVAWQTLRDNFQADDYYSSGFAWKSTTVANVGIKSRGSGSRSPHKPNLTVKFNKYVKQKFLGHNTILLKANNQDGSMMREYLTMSLARRLELPAPREAPARLFVNGEFFGLYTIVENLDEDLLSRVYKDSSGYLYEFNPALGYHFDYLGSDPATYGSMYEAKTHEEAPELGTLFEMLRAINQPTDDFASVGPAHVDVAGFLKLLALENYVSDSDGILSDVWGMNNFYLYRPTTSTQFRFLPWDTDFTLSWAGRPVFHGLENNELARRALEVPALRQVYLEALLQASIVAGGDDGWMRNEIARYYDLIAVDARRDPHKQCWRAGIMVACNADDFEREVAVIKAFAVDRWTAVVPQVKSLLTAPAPKMSEGGAVNAATYQAGLVPGLLAVLYGSSMSRTGESADTWPLPLTLAGVEVTVNGVAAPLLFVSPSQVNFQIPWNLQEGPVTLRISVDGMSSAPLATQLVHAAPGIFAAAHGSDFSLVNAASPAAGGEILSLFGTGLGPVSARQNDGEPASLETLSRTLEPVTATLNGTPLEVLFAGLAPGIAGVYQVNVRMPATVTSGDGSLVLHVAGANSPALRLSLR